MVIHVYDLRVPRSSIPLVRSPKKELLDGSIVKVKVSDVLGVRYITILLDSGYEIEMTGSDFEEIQKAVKEKDSK